MSETAFVVKYELSSFISLLISQRFDYTVPSNWAGNFRHTPNKRDGTLFEISNQVDDNNVCYDLSVVHDIFNVPMKVSSPDG